MDEVSRLHAGALRPARGGFLAGHARPRRAPEHRGAAEAHRGHAAVRHPRFRLRAGPRPEGVHRTWAMSPWAWKARRALPPWRASYSGCEVWEQDFLKLDLPRGALRRRVRQRVAVPCPEPGTAARAAASCTRRSSRAACCSAPIRAAPTRKAGTRGRYGAYHDLEAWRRLPGGRGIRRARPLLPARRACRANSSPGWRASGVGDNVAAMEPIWSPDRAGDRAGADHAVRAPRRAQVQARAEHLSGVLPVDGR